MATITLQTPGILGLISLPVVAITGMVIGMYVVKSMGGLHPLGKVAEHAIMTVVMSGFYWFWAAYKLLFKHDPDFGFVTFLIAGTAAYRTADLCAVQIRLSSSRTKDPKPVLRMQQLLPLACFIPMVNFLGVLILIPTLPFTFQMYLCFGAMTWSIIAIRGGWLLGDDLVVASLRDGPAAEKRAQTLARLKAENDEMQGLCSKPDEEGRA